MPATQGKTDFWVSQEEEPHVARRKAILKKYPKIKELEGPEWRTKYIIIALVAAQTALSYYLQFASWPVYLAVLYIFGATTNHALNLSIHEISHDLAFKTPIYNRILGFIANFPIVFASSITFRRYHLDHHQRQGTWGVDVDIPTRAEGKIFTNFFLKLIWLSLQPFFYALRPLFVRPKKPHVLELANWVAQLSYDFCVFYFFGWRALAYLILCTWVGLGLHPTAGHFVSEHYVFTPGYETYSYYGPLNYVTFNVGLHNEHHDFDRVPWSRLHAIKAMAPEFYDLPHYTSWVGVLWRYATDPNITPFSRVIRQSKKAKSM